MALRKQLIIQPPNKQQILKTTPTTYKRHITQTTQPNETKLILLREKVNNVKETLI